MDCNLVKKALSEARMSTYEKAFPEIEKAIELYAWNANVSAGFLAPLHICEVVIRNAVSDALASEYGEAWPWSEDFRATLSEPGQGYSAKADLKKAASKQRLTSKVIPELKFVFWQSMFKVSHNGRIWAKHLLTIFENLPNDKDTRTLIKEIQNDLDKIRKLRNRIAHHEPIFNRDLESEFKIIERLISLRCDRTKVWMMSNQKVLSYIKNPIT